MLDKNKKENKFQFIINNGIVYNKRDMFMLLRDLGNVSYFEIIGGRIVRKGRGYMMRVCVNSEEPTLFLSGRLYVNVGLFDYLEVKPIKDKDNSCFELHNQERVMRLVPDEPKGIFPPISKETFAERMMGMDVLDEGFFPPDFPPDQAIPGEWSEN